jgi:hypothetical protein
MRPSPLLGLSSPDSQRLFGKKGQKSKDKGQRAKDPKDRKPRVRDDAG